MKLHRITFTAAIAAFLLALASGAAMAEVDKKGSADHPLFTRMPGMFIQSYDKADYEQVSFPVAGGKPEKVEGRMTKIAYKSAKGFPKPSALEIVQNHVNAIGAAGGVVLHQRKEEATMKITSFNGTEVWAKVRAVTGAYTLHVVERAAMAQSVTASAMMDALEKNGFMVIDVQFDTASAVIRPESRPLIGEIAAMMKKNKGLKISVEGHTDNVGDPKSNKALSHARAAAVAGEIVKGGVDAARLRAVGWGEEKPVASNATEDGRQKNRRVEMVKM